MKHSGMKSILCSVLISIAVHSVSVFAQPRIEIIPAQELNFGRVYKGTNATGALTIRNAGTDTLVITDVSAQCGCTATTMAKRSFAPGETGNLSVTFFTEGYDSKVTKHVFIDCNDTANSPVDIECTVHIVQSLKPDPPALTFNVSKPDSVYVSTITLTNTTPEAIHILSVRSDFRDIDITLFKHDLMPGEETELQATLKPSKLGSYEGTLRLETDHSAQPVIELHVFELYRPQ